MPVIVQKYGGSSVADTEKIKRVAEKIVNTYKNGNKVVVVVSAMGKSTDNLINLAKQVHDSPPTREMDLLLSTGEIVSVALLCMAIEKLGYEAEGLPGFLAGIRTDSTHTKARIRAIDTRRILEELKKGKIVVIAGFQGISMEENITTLGRGGSDLTAIAIAGALKADICEIYTDVPGVFTADPNIVPDARIIPVISYQEMLEMASTGAKVMQSRAVEFAQKYHIPFVVKSTFIDSGGTMVTEVDFKEGAVVSSVTLDEKQAKITFFNVPDKPGIAARIFGALGEASINVDVIVQNVSTSGYTDLSFTVNISDLEKAFEISKTIGAELGCKSVTSDNDIAKITVIGLGMMNHPGVAARMFKALAESNINIEMISTSEIKISCIVRKQDGQKALKAVHKEFIK
ncbi:MAG TPA: aspartate kinase [bacterium]|nr:aspartate kinase [bacterium]HOL35914.1 aspartate kinase [bacterium]HPP08341.1 aspartate kinase [bacterium]